MKPLAAMVKERSKTFKSVHITKIK
jgi:hypothetical protein